MSTNPRDVLDLAKQNQKPDSSNHKLIQETGVLLKKCRVFDSGTKWKSTLDLSDYALDSFTSEILEACISKGFHSQLLLRNTQLTDDFIQKHMVNTNIVVHHLDLSQNNLTDLGVKHLTHWLRSPSNDLPLSELNLSRNPMTDESAILLLDTSLEHLTLANTKLGSAFIQALVKKLGDNTLALKHLDLRGHSFSEEDLELLLTTIRDHSYCNLTLELEEDSEKQESLQLALEAQRKRRVAATGDLQRDLFQRVLQFTNLEDWMKMREVNRYFRDAFPFEWTRQGSDVRTFDDMMRRLRHLKRPDYTAVLTGQKTLDEVWIQLRNIRPYMDTLNLKTAKEFDQAVSDYMRTQPLDQSFSYLEFIAGAEARGLIKIPNELKIAGEIRYNQARLILLGYLPIPKTKFDFRNMDSSLVALFDSGHLPPDPDKYYYRLLRDINAANQERVLQVFFNYGITAQQLSSIPEIQQGVEGLRGWKSKAEFIFSDIGTRAIAENWLTREDIANHATLRDLLCCYLKKKYKTAVDALLQTQVLTEDTLAKLPIHFLDVLITDKYVTQNRVNLMKLLKSKILTTEEIVGFCKDFDSQTLLTLAPLITARYLNVTQIRNLLTHIPNEHDNRFETNYFAKVLNRYPTPREQAVQFLGSSDAIAAFDDGTLTYSNLFNGSDERRYLEGSLESLSQLLKNHATTSPLKTELAQLKQSLTFELTAYLNHQSIFHRARANMLKTRIEQAKNLDELITLVEKQLKHYDPDTALRPRTTLFTDLNEGLHHKTKGFVSWTYHKTLLRCEVALKKFQDGHLALPHESKITYLHKG